jgi:myosin-5
VVLKALRETVLNNFNNILISMCLKWSKKNITKKKINGNFKGFSDNKDVPQLREENPVEIISLLDEPCIFPKSMQETFTTKLLQIFKDHNRLKKPNR